MKTILLIESDESLRRRFRKFLEFENYRVLSVKDESFALEFLSGQDIDIDLVILGVSSEPEPLFEELIEGLSNTKVLLLSSSASTAVRRNLSLRKG